eukprot:5377091-Prymnesium_polylepis.1
MRHGSGMRNVAVVVCGESRGFHAEQPRSLAASRLSEHVIGPLERSGHVVHTVLCLEHPEPPNATLVPLLRVRHWANVTPEPVGLPYKLQAARRLACYRELEQYEVRQSVSLHFVLLMRPDAVWFADLPPLSSLASDSITLRVRMLRSGARTFPLRATAVSYPPWFDDFCPHNTPDQNSSADASCQLARSAGCIFTDDQAAAIPRHLAATFF